MENMDEEIKKFLTSKPRFKAKLKKFLVSSLLIGTIMAIITILTIVYANGEDILFTVEIYTGLYIAIEIVLLIGILCGEEMSVIEQFASNINGINNYLANKYNYTLNDNVFSKELLGIKYSFKYDIKGEIILHGWGIPERNYYIASEFKIYNVLNDERLIKILKYDKSDFIDSAVFNYEGIIYKHYKLKDVINELRLMHIGGFEISLRAAIESIKEPDRFSSKNLLEANNKKRTAYSLLVTESDWKNIKLLIITFLILWLFVSIIGIPCYYFGMPLSKLITSYIVFVPIETLITFILICHLLEPSNILTKKFGLREEKNEKFYGRFSNNVPFCITPYVYKTFIHTEKIILSTNIYVPKSIESYNMSLRFKIDELSNTDLTKLEKFGLNAIHFQYNGEEIIFQYEDKNANMEDMVKELLNCAAFVFNLNENEILSKEKNTKYNVKAMLYNFTNRLKDKEWILFCVIAIILLLIFFLNL